MTRKIGKRIMSGIYIAGASSRGQTFKQYITYLYPEIQIISYLVDDILENATAIDGIPVLLIEEGLDISCPVYIATRGANHEKISKELNEVGFENIIPVTVQLDIQLRNAYVKQWYYKNGRKFRLIEELNPGKCSLEGLNGTIYVANSIHDKELKEEYVLKSYEKIIQVGAALTDERVFQDVLTDCEGDNISNRNKQFCELTGLYWLWKHAGEDYVGLVHYRRHFIMPDDWLLKVANNDIDVILPVPLYVAPSIAENYKARHIADDWEYLMRYFENNLPDEYHQAIEIFAGNLYNPCNMFIAKRNVLDDLCTWMFPILDAVWKHGGIKEDSYMNRYPGFISERLITYFFEARRNKYNIVYANKNFLQ